MQTVNQYTNEIFKQFGYLATWLPSIPLKIGDIGIIKGNVFTRVSNLEDKGILFDVINDDTKSDLEYSSKGAVSITTKLSGTIAPTNSGLTELDAGIIVEFSKENAILFKANGTLTIIIKDQIRLGENILQLFKDGEWNKDWAVITELVNAETASILISSSKDGKVELKVKANIEAKALDIANSELNFDLSFSKDVSTKIIAQERLTPLFRTSKVKSRLFASPIFKANNVDTMDLTTPNMAKENSEIVFFDTVNFEIINDD
jgi:hypothetical protein